MSKVKDILGEHEDEFYDFDLTEIQEILAQLSTDQPLDIAHAEMIQQKTLRAADILTEYISKIVKTVSLLETKSNSLRNKAALNYSAPDGKTTADMRKWASESDPEVTELQIALAKAKGTKSLLDKKYEIMIKYHHHAKDIAQGIRKTIVGYHPTITTNTDW